MSCSALSRPGRLAAVGLLLACAWPAPRAHAGDRLLDKTTRAEIRQLIEKRRFGDARKRLAVLALKAPRHRATERRELDELRATYLRARATWLQGELKARFVPTARRLLTEQAKAPDATAQRAMFWVRSRLPHAVGRDVARQLADHDRLSADEVLAAWARRPPGDWHVFVFPLGGQQVDVDQREDWWRSADVPRRVERLFQTLLLGTDLFELGKRDPKVPCGKCAGRGVEHVRGTHGRITYRDCRRCKGRKYAAATRWR